MYASNFFLATKTNTHTHTKNPHCSLTSHICQPVGINMLTELHAGADECSSVHVQHRLEEPTEQQMVICIIFFCTVVSLRMWGIMQRRDFWHNLKVHSVFTKVGAKVLV